MTARMSKKEQARRRFAANIGYFQCPICYASVAITESGVRCSQNHSFDLARKGYLNLFAGSQTDMYDKELFSARKQAFIAGVYEPVVYETATYVTDLGFDDLFVLDAGCGEGSFFARFSEHIRNANLVGIDISKEGIKLATGHHQPVMWCVADLARLPCATESTSVVLNVLSPANYSEFRRVLKPGGVIIKVLPGQDYLREIRDRLAGVAAYSNEDVLARFRDNVKVQRSSRLLYQVPVTSELWQIMVRMTPLSQNRDICGDPPSSLTIDLNVLQGAW